ncbi:hypothetical protein FKB36_12610 [Methanoculleus sp. Afa-1]|uniref:Uncharacterized protein n=1 Tax=Methanoculleus formosensis TaxID=2590886 RepID=A0A9E4ZNE2_9EURY|nr:hypothetical protein [Methanoculleus sp. Afa-1]MCT8338304.1 hypothetical protein [Methanoculleus sp. Afa-1]
MQSIDHKDGSPRDEACANIDSHGTATSSSPPGVIRPSEEDRVSTVPLFLVPRAVADVIRRYGRAVREIHVRRTRNHHYTVEIERGRP